MIPILATLFDKAYLLKGLALIRSLQQHQADFRLFVLALDDASYSAVCALNDRRVIATTFYSELFSDTALGAALAGRTKAEACYTLTPLWTRAVMQSFQLSHITYLDADSFLFGAFDPFYAEIGDASVGIVPHRFPERMKWREKENGIFNVNGVYFRNDATGCRALDAWAAQCLAWCFNRTERAGDGSLLFGDQGYLDAFPERYGAHVVNNIGINLAPWNQEQYEYAFDNGNLYVIQKDGARVTQIEKVRLYHFHELSMNLDGSPTTAWQRPTFRRGNHPLCEPVIEHLYKPYEKVLTEIYANLDH